MTQAGPGVCLLSRGGHRLARHGPQGPPGPAPSPLETTKGRSHACPGSPVCSGSPGGGLRGAPNLRGAEAPPPAPPPAPPHPHKGRGFRPLTLLDELLRLLPDARVAQKPPLALLADLTLQVVLFRDLQRQKTALLREEGSTPAGASSVRPRGSVPRRAPRGPGLHSEAWDPGRWRPGCSGCGEPCPRAQPWGHVDLGQRGRRGWLPSQTERRPGCAPQEGRYGPCCAGHHACPFTPFKTGWLRGGTSSRAGTEGGGRAGLPGGGSAAPESARAEGQGRAWPPAETAPSPVSLREPAPPAREPWETRTLARSPFPDGALSASGPARVCSVQGMRSGPGPWLGRGAVYT